MGRAAWSGEQLRSPTSLLRDLTTSSLPLARPQLSTLLPSVKLNLSPKVSVCTLLASLFFLEVIGLRYYRGDFTLFKMLPFFLAGSAVAVTSVIAGALEGIGAASGTRKGQ